jgi:hypothetical protein
MPFDLYRRIIDEAAQIADEVNLSFFGEPTLHPEFLTFMDYLKNVPPRLRVVLNTNLACATRRILEKLIEVELAEVRLSLDAATAEIYDAVRPGEYFVDLEGTRGTTRRFETICRKAELWFSLVDHRPTRHVFTVHSRNVHEVGAYVRRWLPCLGDDDHIVVKSVITYGGKVSDPMITDHPCNVWDLPMLMVDWTGRTSPCNLDVNMDLTIGSICESSLLDMHYGQKRREVKRLSLSREAAPCKACVDANNWSRNFVFRKGDTWDPRCQRTYSEACRPRCHAELSGIPCE